MENKTRQVQRAGRLIGSCSDQELKDDFKKIFFLIGVPDYKLPEFEYLIEYLKRSNQWSKIFIEEVIESFESASENLFINVSLEGKAFNPAFMKQVLIAYREFKGKQKIVPPDSQTSKQRVSSIFSLMAEHDPALVESLKNMGSKKKVYGENYSPQNDIYQQLMKEFDDLYKDQLDQYDFARTSIRAVKYEGKMLSMDDYLKSRIQEESNPS